MINKEYVTDRGIKREYYFYCRSSVRQYMRTAPTRDRKLFEEILKRMPECWTFLYAFKSKL